MLAAKSASNIYNNFQKFESDRIMFTVSKLELTFAKIQVGHSVYKSRIKSKDEIWVVHLYLALFTDGWEGGAQPLPPPDSGVSR